MRILNELGTIELFGKVVVSDPCYDRDVWCMVDDLAVKPGRYKTWSVLSDESSWGMRVAALVLIHEDFTEDDLKNWKSIECSIGVDSGQCGIFDDSIYPQKKEPQKFESFYKECCDITLSDKSAGIMKNGKGVVSSSGYGDGTYELFAVIRKGEYVALTLNYNLTKMRNIMRLLVERQQNNEMEGVVKNAQKMVREGLFGMPNKLRAG